MTESLNPKEAAKQAVKSQLDEMERAVRDSGVALTRAEIARRVGVAPSAVSNWFKGPGGQLPRVPQLESLAQVLSLGDERIAFDYRDKLFKAAGIELGLLTPWERAQPGGGKIRIGVVKYDPAVDSFFREIATSFGQFCGFPVDLDDVQFSKLTEELASGRLDLGFGLWETPDRLLSLRFLATPLEMGMNMLGLGTAIKGLKAESGLADISKIRPIMNEGQASYRSAQHVLGFNTRDILTCDYDPDLFQAKLLEAFYEWRGDEALGIPVLITDELMCWKVFNGLLNRISASLDERRELGMPVLLTEEAGWRWARDRQLVAAHPRYNVSVCIKRVANDPWFNFVEDAWRIFIRGNRRFLALKYEELCLKLKTQLDETHALTAGPDGSPSDEARCWAAIYWDWLFDHQLRDFHDEETWKEITGAVRAGGGLKEIGRFGVKPANVEAGIV